MSKTVYNVQPWHPVQIGVNGKKLHLGRFASEDEAAKAYDSIARRHSRDTVSFHVNLEHGLDLGILGTPQGIAPPASGRGLV